MPMIKKPWNWRRPLTKEIVITKDVPTTKPKAMPTTTTKPKPKPTTTTTKQEPMGWNDVGDWIPGGIVPTKKNGLPQPSKQILEQNKKDEMEPARESFQINPMKKEQSKGKEQSVSTANMVAMKTNKGRKKGIKKQYK